MDDTSASSQITRRLIAAGINAALLSSAVMFFGLILTIPVVVGPPVIWSVATAFALYRKLVGSKFTAWTVLLSALGILVAALVYVFFFNLDESQHVFSGLVSPLLARIGTVGAVLLGTGLTPLIGSRILGERFALKTYGLALLLVGLPAGLLLLTPASIFGAVPYWQVGMAILLSRVISPTLAPAEVRSTNRQSPARGTEAKTVSARPRWPISVLISLGLFAFAFPPARTYYIFLFESESTELGAASMYYSFFIALGLLLILATLYREHQLQKLAGGVQKNRFWLYALIALAYPVYLLGSAFYVTNVTVPAGVFQQAVAHGTPARLQDSAASWILSIPHDLKIETLTEGHAKALVRTGELRLDVTKRLTDGAASVLGSAKPEEKEFPSRSYSLGPDGTETLVSEAYTLTRNAYMQFDGLEELTPTQARALAQFPGPLTLGLKTISADVAEELGNHRGGLALKNITNLDVAAARALARSEGELTLGLAVLPGDVAEALSSHTGDLVLDQLTTLDPGAGEAVVRIDGSFRFSQSKLSVADDAGWAALIRANAEEFEAYDKEQRNSDGQLLSWARQEGQVSFGMTEIGDKTAQALAEFPGFLISLSKVETVSDSAVDLLARRRAPRLILCNAKLTDAQREKLSTPPTTPPKTLVDYVQSYPDRYSAEVLYRIKQRLTEAGWSDGDALAALWSLDNECSQ